MDNEQAKRIDIAASCTDCRDVPRVDNAGQVVTVSGRDFQIMHNGLRVGTASHYGAFNTEVIKHLKGHHEPQEEKVFHEVLKHVEPGGCMIELGCFWAYYSMWFQHAVPGGQNFMVEPIDRAIACGQENFRLNKMAGDFTQACVGRNPLERTRFVSWDDSVHELPQIAVDDYLDKKDIDRVSILHADIQGAEYEMLLGCEQSIADGRIDHIFISTHSELLHKRCIGFLKGRGFRIIASHTMAESYSVDGLIVAAAPHCPGTPEVEVSRKAPTLRERYRLCRDTIRNAISKAA